MESPAPAMGLGALTIILVGLPICFFLFFKSFRAQSRKVYWTYNALIAVVMLVMFGLLNMIGAMPSPEQVRQRHAEAPPPLEVLSNFPTPYLVLVGLVALIWLGGGNWVIIRQRRKAGRSWWDCFNPLNPPFRDMTAMTWLQLALLAVLALAVFAVGVNMIDGVAPAAIGDLPSN